MIKSPMEKWLAYLVKICYWDDPKSYAYCAGYYNFLIGRDRNAIFKTPVMNYPIQSWLQGFDDSAGDTSE
jgi:hypothetical protein